jgi:hypothetical protein
MKAMNRRKFLKGSLLGGAAASVISKSKNADASPSFGAKAKMQMPHHHSAGIQMPWAYWST